MQSRGHQRRQNGLRDPRRGGALADCGGSLDLLEYPVPWVFILPNIPARRPRASDAEYATQTQSLGSVQSASWALFVSRQYVPPYAASRSLPNGAKCINPSSATQPDLTQDRSNLTHNRNVVRGLVGFERPLLLRALQLFEIGDAIHVRRNSTVLLATASHKQNNANDKAQGFHIAQRDAERRAVDGARNGTETRSACPFEQELSGLRCMLYT